MTVQARGFSAADEVAWDEFVRRHPHGGPFHLIAWKKSIEEAYGYASHYLLATDETGVRGVLPLFLVETFVIGKALISSPFAVYGGILADGAEARDALTERVRALGAELRADYVELRNAYPEQCAGFSRVPSAVTFTAPIGGDEGAMLAVLPRKTRATVRKALLQGFASRRQTTDSSAFEKLYAENLQRLGTPSFHPRHFERLIANFGSGVDIREVHLDGKLVAGVMSFHFRDQVLPYYGTADFRYNALAPTSFMYFDQMRWAGKNGFRLFDFGRSQKESGSADFKAHWGMKARELPYEILLVNRRELPHHGPSSTAHLRFAMVLWRRLPLKVTRTLGPKMVRLVP